VAVLAVLGLARKLLLLLGLLTTLAGGGLLYYVLNVVDIETKGNAIKHTVAGIAVNSSAGAGPIVLLAGGLCILIGALVDPLPTLRNLADFVGLPVGAVCRHALVQWVSAGSEALLEVGPAWVRRLGEPVARAEATGTDEARLAAYEELRGLLGWLAAGLDEGPFDADPSDA